MEMDKVLYAWIGHMNDYSCLISGFMVQEKAWRRRDLASQNLDAGIIAAVSIRYRHHDMECAVNLADVGVKQLYKRDILTDMMFNMKVW